MFPTGIRLGTKKYTNKKAYASKRGNKEIDEEDYYSKAEQSFDDKQVTMLSSKIMYQASFDDVSSEYIRNVGIPENSHDKKLQLHFRSLLAYLEACTIPKDRQTNMFFTSADMKLLHGVLCMVVTVFEPHSPLPEAYNWKLAAVSKKIRQGILRINFAWKRANLTHFRYAVLGGFGHVSRVLTAALNVLEWPQCF